MSDEISFVEVLMIHYEPGDKEYQDFFENEVHCFLGNWEDCSEEIPEVVAAKKKQNNLKMRQKQKGKVFGLLHRWHTVMIP